MSLLKAIMSYAMVNLLMRNLSHLNLNLHSWKTCYNRHPGKAGTNKQKDVLFSSFVPCALFPFPQIIPGVLQSLIGSVYWALGTSFCLHNAVTAGFIFASTFMVY